MVNPDSAPNPKTLYGLLLFGIAIVIIFSLIFVFFGIRLHDETICTTKVFFDSSGRDKTPTNSFNLEQNMTYLYQVNITPYTKQSAYTVYLSSNHYGTVDVVDETGHVHATLLVDNDTTQYATSIVFANHLGTEYLGLRCTSCNETNNVTWYKNLNGPFTSVKVLFNENYVDGFDERISYDLVHQENCQRLFKIMYRAYIWSLVVMLIIILILTFQQYITNLIGGIMPPKNYDKD